MCRYTCDGRVHTSTEIAVVQKQAKECQESLELRDGVVTSFS